MILPFLPSILPLPFFPSAGFGLLLLLSGLLPGGRIAPSRPRSRCKIAGIPIPSKKNRRKFCLSTFFPFFRQSKSVIIGA